MNRQMWPWGLFRPDPVVRQRASLQDWIQRLLIGLACLWLLLGVVLPLLELLARATRVELPVAIEMPSAQEMTADPFRGEIAVAGYTLLLMAEGDYGQIYLNNQAVASDGYLSSPDLEIWFSRETLQKVIVRGLPPGRYVQTRQGIRPIVIEPAPASSTETPRWMVDGRTMPPDTRTLVVNRFIGLANFMQYFGIRGLTQGQLLAAMGAILSAIGLAVAPLFWSGWKMVHLGRAITALILLLLLLQAGWGAHRIYVHSGYSNLAQSAWNSLAVGLATTLIAVTLAFVYAYGMTRTCMRGKTVFRVIAMLPLFAPTMLFGLSLVYLFGNQGLITTGFFGYLGWLAWDINLYGFTGIVLAEVAFTFPPAMMILSVALTHTDARLYEAAASLGAGPLRTFFTVTLPGVKYGLLSAIFVCFTLSFTDFGAPKVVGGHFNVLAVDIYKQVVGQQNFGMGATVSIILLAPTLLAFIADRMVQRRSHAALTARSVPLIPAPTPGRDVLFTIFCSLIALMILAMLFTAGMGSLIKIWPYALSHPELYPERWTLAHYTFRDVGGGGYQAFWTSMRMAAYTALFGALITFVSAWLIEKTKGAQRLRQSAYLLSIAPLALPGLVIGIAYVFFFNQLTLGIPFTGLKMANPFLFLYGTMALLVISNIIHFYTVSFLTATTALRQLDKEFEVVSESMGAPFYRIFFKVTVPVCFPAIVEIAAYYFVSATATVSAVIFLYSSRLPLASVAVVNMDDAGDTAAAAAMCMLIVLANILVRSAAEGIGWLFARKTQAWRRA